MKQLLLFLSRKSGRSRWPDLLMMNDSHGALVGDRAAPPEGSRLPGGRRIPTLFVVHDAFDYNLGDVPFTALARYSGLSRRILHGFHFEHARMEGDELVLSGSRRARGGSRLGRAPPGAPNCGFLALGAVLHADLVMGVSPTPYMCVMMRFRVGRFLDCATSFPCEDSFHSPFLA